MDHNVIFSLAEVIKLVNQLLAQGKNRSLVLRLRIYD